jgi:hypothetical protein
MDLDKTKDEDLRFELESRGYIVLSEMDLDRASDGVVAALRTRNLRNIAEAARDYINTLTGKFYAL